jgi:hypothetical protein
MQLLQSFFSRSISQSVFVTGIFGNLWIVGAFLLSFGAMVAGFYIPGMVFKAAIYAFSMLQSLTLILFYSAGQLAGA